MDKMKSIALGLIAVLVLAGIGTTVIYLQKNDAQNDKDGLEARAEMQTELSAVQSEIWEQFGSTSENLTEASLMLRTTGLNGTDARTVLDDLRSNVSFVIDVVTIDTNGRIVAAEPAEYQGAEGTDISGQAHVQRMLETMMPVMSEVFVMVEGFSAAVIAVPIFTADGTFNGSVSVQLDMESMLREAVEGSVDTAEFQFTCLQTDGLEVYDTDEDQIGRYLFTDPAYENYTAVLEFMHGLVGENRGYGTYEYERSLGSHELVEKEVYWSSVGLYGTEWRLLIIHAV